MFGEISIASNIGPSKESRKRRRRRRRKSRRRRLILYRPPNWMCVPMRRREMQFVPGGDAFSDVDLAPEVEEEGVKTHSAAGTLKCVPRTWELGRKRRCD